MEEPRLDFAAFYEGLFLRGLGERVTPRLKERLREAGLDLDKPLLPAYPAEKLPVFTRMAAAEVLPDLAEPEAMKELGRIFLGGYFNTVIGAAMGLAMRAIGTTRTLKRMTRNFRSGGNYIETTLTELGPKEAELWINEVHGVPEFYAGLIERGGEQVGTVATAAIVKREGASATFNIRWT